ncbi:UNVERIFIED_ORG: hypothetical protein M2425_002401 [Bradyrhizobium japonicum]
MGEIDSAVRRLGTARAENKTCPVTGSVQFGQALEIILAQLNTARRIASIHVERPDQRARLAFKFKNNPSRFGGETPFDYFRMKIEAELPGYAVWCIADDLNDIADGKPMSIIEQRITQMRSDPHERWLRFFRGDRRS